MAPPGTHELLPATDDVLDVLVIGGGFSGVCAAIALLKQGVTCFRVFEKSAGIGGTWWENTYPGAACDVPSHLYCFSFELNPNWSRLYSPQSEIQQYIEHCVDKYGIRPYLQFGATVQSLKFDDTTGLWRAHFTDGTQATAHHVINGGGALQQPLIPDFPGAEEFTGAQMHTAVWDHSVDFSGKRVAVIGSAASAVQVVPELARVANHVSVFQRTPNYIAPRNDFAYSALKKKLFSAMPWWNRFYRWIIFMRLETQLYPLIVNEKRRRKLTELVRQFMRDSVTRTEWHDALSPQYEMGCKRILISDDFYPALNRDNVSLVTSGISHLTSDALVTRDGAEHPADAVVYATGFDIGRQLFSIDVTGRDGVTLQDAWHDTAFAYRGVMLPGFPNYYMTTGPNTGVGTSSVIYTMEAAIGWILQSIRRAGRSCLISPRADATARFNDDIQTALQRTVWSTGCDSWYQRNGKIETLYPMNARTFRRSLEQVCFEDLHVELKPGVEGYEIDAATNFQPRHG